MDANTKTKTNRRWTSRHARLWRASCRFTRIGVATVERCLACEAEGSPPHVLCASRHRTRIGMSAHHDSLAQRPPSPVVVGTHGPRCGPLSASHLSSIGLATEEARQRSTNRTSRSSSLPSNLRVHLRFFFASIRGPSSPFARSFPSTFRMHDGRRRGEAFLVHRDRCAAVPVKSRADFYRHS
jgi:hypothetical protein